MNRITELFGIKYPIIQAGMLWSAPWELASAVSNAGGLGLIGSASMYPDVLRTHIQKCKKATDKPFGVNMALMYPDIEKHIRIVIEEGVKIVFTSAGNPKLWTRHLQEHGIKVAHVVSSVKFAMKAREAGVDAIVGEGFEAGGHNGREELTTMVLIPAIYDALRKEQHDEKTALVAAGGIAGGKAMLAAMALGADGVQIGSRFVASLESSAHPNFKKAVTEAGEGQTMLTMKQLMPVRLLHNHFFEEVREAEKRGATDEEMKTLLGRARAKKGMFEGDLKEGELEIGQVSGYIHEIKPAAEIVKEIWEEFLREKERVCKFEN